MRQTISGLVAVIGLAVAGTAPAAACGVTGCGACSAYAEPCAPAYVYQPAYTYQPSYTYGYSGCGTCGATYERLAEPTTQYYYVNQGPTYTGPGAFAPYPAYRESALPVYGYGYAHHRYAHYYAGAGVAGPSVYHHRRHRTAYRWGYSHYYQGRPVLRRYY